MMSKINQHIMMSINCNSIKLRDIVVNYIVLIAQSFSVDCHTVHTQSIVWLIILRIGRIVYHSYKLIIEHLSYCCHFRKAISHA